MRIIAFLLTWARPSSEEGASTPGNDAEWPGHRCASVEKILDSRPPPLLALLDQLVIPVRFSLRDLFTDLSKWSWPAFLSAFSRPASHHSRLWYFPGAAQLLCTVECMVLYHVCWVYDYCEYSIFMRRLDPYPFHTTSAYDYFIIFKILSLYLIHSPRER